MVHQRLGVYEGKIILYLISSLGGLSVIPELNLFWNAELE